MNELARLMLDHSPEMALLVNPVTLQVMMANAAACKTLDYSLEQLQALEITEVESALQDVFYWEDVRAGQYLEVQSQDGLYRRADGELLAVRKTIQLLNYQGTPLLLVQAAQTKQERRAEDALAHTLSQLRATLESTGNGILVIGWQGKIESMNHLPHATKLNQDPRIGRQLGDARQPSRNLNHLTSLQANGLLKSPREQTLAESRNSEKKN